MSIVAEADMGDETKCPDIHNRLCAFYFTKHYYAYYAFCLLLFSLFSHSHPSSLAFFFFLSMYLWLFVCVRSSM